MGTVDRRALGFDRRGLLPWLVAGLLAAGAADAADLTIAVTWTGDVGMFGDGLCSLREAIESANDLVQEDSCGPGEHGDPLPVVGDDRITIDVPAGIYELELAGADEDLNVTGDLDLHRIVTLQGAGLGVTVIDGMQLDRVLELHGLFSFSDRAVIRDLSLRGGRPPAEQDGGCLRSLNSQLLLDRVEVAECETPDPGVGGLFGGSGGGLAIEGGAVEIRRSEIVDNTTFKASGGGIWVVDATVDVVRTPIARNLETIPNGTVSGGGLANLSGTVNVHASAVLDNEVTGQGGGLFNFTFGEKTLNVMNTTVARNRATGSGGGIRSYGDLSLTHVTITENVADSDGEGNGQGGGVRLGGQSNTVIKGSIVAWNEDHSPPPSTTIFPDISGTVTSAGFNIVLDGAGLVGIVDGVLGDSVGVDPLLDLPTGTPEYFPLLPASTAIDQIPRLACVAVSYGANTLWSAGTGVQLDQRGVGRGTLCEIGAFEDRTPEIFEDDWEAGDLSAWSLAVP